jgi:hypothetical protein
VKCGECGWGAQLGEEGMCFYILEDSALFAASSASLLRRGWEPSPSPFDPAMSESKCLASLGCRKVTDAHTYHRGHWKFPI